MLANVHVVVLVFISRWVQLAIGFTVDRNHRHRHHARQSSGRSQFWSIPSWSDLEVQLGDSYRATSPISIDPALETNVMIPPFSTERPTLFRERHGWCPYSERVWLTLELCNISYDTIRIDNTGGPRPHYFGGQTPQIKWPDGTQQGESMDLVGELDVRHHQGGLQSQDPTVQKIASEFRNIFPRARPSSRAAFLFQNNGDPLGRPTFERTLAAVDTLLAETRGHFLAGPCLTAADIAWCPFLERYRYQLPCLHAGLEPYNPKVYPHLATWYKAMDQVPAYACRVKGDASSWRKVLTMAGFGNAGIPPQIDQNMQDLMDKELQQARDCIDQDLWDAYRCGTRDYVADTPAAEAAQIICKNREAIMTDTVKQATRSRKWKDTDLPSTQSQVDEALRELVEVLLNDNGDVLTNNSRRTIGALSTFLDERTCVPRDMGSMSASAIKVLAWNLRTFN